MKAFRIIYNSLIWGILASIIAFQSKWLEMRMNTALIIPLFAIFSIIVILVYNTINKGRINVNFKFSLGNLCLCFIAAVLILGNERTKVVPASIIREGLHISHISFSIINAFIAAFLALGLLLIWYVELRIKLKEMKESK